jgi:YNFM family putative membrane transporter
MAYLSEEMHLGSIGLAMGLYISGTALGGMSGRLITGVLTDLFSWRVALAANGVLGLLAAFLFWRTLPRSVNFNPRPLSAPALLGSFCEHLKDSGLRQLFAEGFLLMGTFVTVYNYVGYRLTGAPYRLSQSQVGLVFIVYLVGTASSAWFGDLAGKRGRRKVFWSTILLMLAGLAISLLSPLPWIIGGIAVLTCGFFGAHSIVSSWVGIRARHSKAQASSLYLFSYYLGSSIIGSSGGIFWNEFGWRGIAGFTGLLLLIALFLSVRLLALRPLAEVVKP